MEKKDLPTPMVLYKKLFRLKEAIYLLTDGYPSTGFTVNPKIILQNVKNWNKNRKIIINTIGIGLQQNSEFLNKLAKENNIHDKFREMPSSQ